MPEQVSLLSKEPSYLGNDNKFISLGIMKWRGDKFMAFMNLEDGQIYIEEVFATQALGDFIAGFKNIEEDKVWNMMCYAANSYGLTSQGHLANCIKQLNPKSTPATEAILKGINPQNIGKKKK